jgi:hypothetical protein
VRALLHLETVFIMLSLGNIAEVLGTSSGMCYPSGTQSTAPSASPERGSFQEWVQTGVSHESFVSSEVLTQSTEAADRAAAGRSGLKRCSLLSYNCCACSPNLIC